MSVGGDTAVNGRGATVNGEVAADKGGDAALCLTSGAIKVSNKNMAHAVRPLHLGKDNSSSQ